MYGPLLTLLTLLDSILKTSRSTHVTSESTLLGLRVCLYVSVCVCLCVCQFSVALSIVLLLEIAAAVTAFLLRTQVNYDLIVSDLSLQPLVSILSPSSSI